MKPSRPGQPKKPNAYRASVRRGSGELITLEECKKYLGEFEISDRRMLEIRNSVIGIVDHILNGYLDSFGRAYGKRI